MRIIVTGGAGFIGSALIRHLVLEMGHIVLNIDKLTYAGSLESLKSVSGNPNYFFLKADICNRAAMDQAFADFRPDRVMHLAAESHVDRSIVGANAFIQTNIVGTYNLLDVAKRYWERLPDAVSANFRFLHVSTDEVYGSLGSEGLFRETTPYAPSSPYSASKASSDHLVKAWYHTYGFPALISNCSNNYGPYQFPEKLIPLIILNAISGKSLPVYGKGQNIRDWLYVEDHVRALDLIVDRGELGETYNVGGRNEQRNIDVVLRICDILDKIAPRPGSYKEKIVFVEDRPGHDARYAIDASKLEDNLGWIATEDFESGINKTVRWYLNNEPWWRPLEGRYNRDRLGLEGGPVPS